MDDEREAGVCDEEDASDELGGLVRLDNLLYLLFELEGALDRGGIEWAPDQAKAVFQRLLRITARVGVAVQRAETTG
jgi:hypothetical protein